MLQDSDIRVVMSWHESHVTTSAWHVTWDVHQCQGQVSYNTGDWRQDQNKSRDWIIIATYTRNEKCHEIVLSFVRWYICNYPGGKIGFLIIDTQVNGHHSYARSKFLYVLSTIVVLLKCWMRWFNKSTSSDWMRRRRTCDIEDKVQCKVDTFIELKWQYSIFSSHLNHSTFQEPWKQCWHPFLWKLILYLIFSREFIKERWWRGDR